MRKGTLVLLTCCMRLLARGDVTTGPIFFGQTGHFYYLLTENTWEQSEAEALRLGGHLVTINDIAEQTWVFNTFSAFGGVNRSLWTGLYMAGREGEFAWTTGEPLGYSNWLLGMPDNISQIRNYVLIGRPSPEGLLLSGYTEGAWINTDDGGSSFPELGPFSGVVEVVGPSLSIEFKADQAVLSWPSLEGRSYRVQSSDQLTRATWQDASDVLKGTGLELSFSEGIDPRQGAAKYFRVLIVQ